jgi:signal transduction histidine kinase
MQRENVDFGWAGRTLDDSMQRAVAGGIAAWQLVTILAAMNSTISGSIWTLVIPHLVACGIAAGLTITSRRAWPCLVACYAATVLDYRAMTDLHGALAYITLWCSIMTTATPILMIPRRAACCYSLLSLGVITQGLLTWHADWGWQRVMITAATATALAIAALILMDGLRRLTSDTDRREAAAADERRELEVRRAVAQSAAEDGRTLHDTLINTLSAIAAGGEFIKDTATVRQRCARDAAALEARLAGSDNDDERALRLTPPAHLAEGIPIRRTGLDEDELERYALQLPANTPRALRGAVHELIRNAAKHSGADRIDVHAECDGATLTITVSDDGVGFDGRLLPGRGLAESVVARARGAGVDVGIATGPGTGTAVTLTVSLADAVSLDIPAALHNTASLDQTDEGADADVVGQIRLTACWTWAVVMVGFGAASIIISRPGSALGQCAMLAVVAGLSLAAWWRCRDGEALPGWLTGLALAGVPLAFMAGLSGVNFASHQVVDWPTIAMTPLLIVLLVTAHSRLVVVAEIGLLALGAAASAYLAQRHTPGAAATVAAGAAAEFGLFACWLFFSPVLDQIGVRRAASQREAAATRIERATRDTVAAARARWTAAGVRQGLEIVRGIADGDIDASDRLVRKRCAGAEQHLRQLLQLNPETVHLNPWIGRAMLDARAKSVSLVVRGCTEDAPTAQTASALGQVILSAVAATSPGAELSVGLFPTEQTLELLIVGSAGALGGLVMPAIPPETPPASYQRLDAQDLIELAVLRPSSNLPAHHRQRPTPETDRTAHPRPSTSSHRSAGSSRGRA